jgi:hypothetical protein
MLIKWQVTRNVAESLFLTKPDESSIMDVWIAEQNREYLPERWADAQYFSLLCTTHWGMRDKLETEKVSRVSSHYRQGQVFGT